MRTRVQKWGNSLAVRLPKAFAEEIHIKENTWVELTLVDGKLTIMPVQDSPVSLEELLAGVTEENIHTEFDFGAPQGTEIW